MCSKDIRPEWVPSSYREVIADEKAGIISQVKTVLYAGKGIYIKQVLKRKSSK